MKKDKKDLLLFFVSYSKVVNWFPLARGRVL